MKMNEWIGRFVRLKDRISTNGGVVFTKGEVLVVSGHHRGRLCLERPEVGCRLCVKGFPLVGPDHVGTQALGMIPTTRCARQKAPVCVDRVPRDDVELLPEKPHKVLEAIMRSAELLAESCGGVLAYELDGGKLDKFDPKKVRMFQSVSAGSGIVRGEDGLPTALMLG